MEINQEWIAQQREVCQKAIALDDDAQTCSITLLKQFANDGIAALDALGAAMKENERLKDSLGRHVQAEIGVSMSLSEFFPDHGEDHERIIIAAAKASAEIARLTAERDAAYDVIARTDYQLDKHQTCAAIGNRQYAHGIRDARKIIAQMLPVCAENAQEVDDPHGQ